MRLIVSEKCVRLIVSEKLVRLIVSEKCVRLIVSEKLVRLIVSEKCVRLIVSEKLVRLIVKPWPNWASLSGNIHKFLMLLKCCPVWPPCRPTNSSRNLLLECLNMLKSNMARKTTYQIIFGTLVLTTSSKDVARQRLKWKNCVES